MANTFKLFIEQGGAYNEVRAVFPFTSGELLDERLDEAKVVFFSRDKNYKPLTEFKVEFNESGTVSEEYYILANDNSAEYPAGSEVYRHEAYLIERTKLLEGVVCPSLTFTNTLPKSFKGIKNRVYAKSEDEKLNGYEGYPTITTPIGDNQNYNCVPIEDIGTSIATFLDSNNAGRWTYIASEGARISYFDIYLDGELSIDNVASYNLTASQLKGKKQLMLSYQPIISEEAPLSTAPVYHRYTINFTIQVVELDKKSLAPWTITECINRVLECAEPVFCGPIDTDLGASERFSFMLSGVTYSLDNSLDSLLPRPYIANPANFAGTALKYKNVIAPEFTMTQATLREQLKVIGSFIHAEPYISGKDEQTGAYIIDFLDYGSQRSPTEIGSNTPYISNTLKSDINGFCTDVRSNAQNLINSLSYARGAIIEPTSGESGKPYYLGLKGETQYAIVTDKDGYADTNYPIYEIGSVLCGLFDYNYNWLYYPKDITPYIFEATEYGANLDSFNGGYPYAKNYAIYYTIGQKGLHGLFYQAPSATSEAADSPFAIANILAAVNGVDADDAFKNVQRYPSNLVFQITYKPIAPAFISHGKQLYVSGEQKFSQIYNQGENLIETGYFGENLKGVAARLGNVEQERTYMLSSLSQVPRVSEMIDGYAISAVHTEFMPSYVKCTLGLSKKFIRISEYVGVSSNKRMYEISERQAQTRDILIKEDIVISNTPGESDDYVIFNDLEKLIMPLWMNAYNIGSVTGIDYRVKGVFFKAFDKKLNPIALPDSTDGNQYKFSNGLFLPVLCRSFGNSVHLSFKMKDNYSAGNKTPYIEKRENNIYGRFMLDIPYTDFYGRIYYAGIAFGTNIYAPNRPGEIVFEMPENITSIGAWSFLNENFIKNRAKDADGNVTDSLSGMFSTFHRVRKDNREILSYNVEAEFKTDIPELIIGSELAARCRLITNEVKEVVIFFSNKPINKFASNINPQDGLVVSDPTIYTRPDNGIRFIIDYNKRLYKYWAIVTKPETVTNTYADEGGGTVDITSQTGGNVLLAGTTDMFYDNGSDTYRLDLYFKTKRR